MGLYYSTDMVLRWYKADDSQLKQDRGRTQYTAISNDALVDLRENGTTGDNVRQWLEGNHVPPDGYTSPYDGTISDDALAQMTQSTADARAVTRAYSLLGDDGDDEQDNLYPLVLSNAIPALHEFRKLFLKEETEEQHMWRLLNLCPDMPPFIAEKFRYIDEAISMLCGLSSRQSNYLAAGYVLSCICNGVQREHNKKLNNGLPILHKVPPKRDYGRYFCIMAEKGGTSHGGLTEKLSLFFHAKKQEVNAYGR